MRSLAAEVGCSTMAIYRWYKDKDDVVSAVRVDGFNRMAAKLEKALEHEGPAADRPHALGKAYLRFARANPDFYRLLLDTNPDHNTTPVELKKAVDRMKGAMKACVDLMNDEGLISADSDTFRRQMWATLHGVILLDNVGLLGSAPNKVLVATVDALINKHRPRKAKKATHRSKLDKHRRSTKVRG